MATTIQISSGLLEVLKAKKIHAKESYEDVIWDLVEDSAELSEETKRNIAIAEEQIKRGETISWEEVERKLALKKNV